jgi:hypothetical protein
MNEVLHVMINDEIAVVALLRTDELSLQVAIHHVQQI